METLGPALVASLLFGLFGWFLISCARASARTAELIEDTPTTPVGSLTPGLREARGKVVPAGALLTSPMSQKPCVYYSFKVREQHTRRNSKGKTSTHWETVIDDSRSAPFSIDDGTGRATVDLAGADLRLSPDASARSGFLSDAPPALESLLQQRYGRSTQGWIFNKSMRYQETVLAPGDELYVLGLVRTGGAGPGFGSGGEVYLVSEGSEESLKGSYSSSSFWSGCFGYLMVAAAVAAPVLALLARR